MSKEYLEALETLKDMLIGNGVNDNINDYVDNLILSVKQALLELKSIKEATPSEALELVDKMANYILLDEEYGFIDEKEKQVIIKDRDIIKQALLKWQEPKHYLKWEDLEFANEVKEMKVKLGDNTYEIEYYICNALGLHQPVVILKTSDFIAITIEQFFNDLHLERVE